MKKSALLVIMLFTTAASIASPVIQGYVMDAVDANVNNLFINNYKW